MVNHTFRVGFSRICITPEEPMPPTGFANDAVQFHKDILDDIQASCIALTDADDNTALLITIDACWIQDTLGIPLRKAIWEATGVPEDHVYLCATHPLCPQSVHLGRSLCGPIHPVLDQKGRAMLPGRSGRQKVRRYAGGFSRSI